MTTPAELKPLTSRLNLAAPLDIAGYESDDGYAALRKAVKEMQPAEITQLVKDANLRGRGGAGFPAGVKWALVPMGADAPRQ
jgi:NADH-quinone oxidoreductase subunit F